MQLPPPPARGCRANIPCPIPVRPQENESGSHRNEHHSALSPEPCLRGSGEKIHFPMLESERQGIGVVNHVLFSLVPDRSVRQGLAGPDRADLTGREIDQGGQTSAG